MLCYWNYFIRESEDSCAKVLKTQFQTIEDTGKGYNFCKKSIPSGNSSEMWEELHVVSVRAGPCVSHFSSSAFEIIAVKSWSNLRSENKKVGACLRWKRGIVPISKRRRRLANLSWCTEMNGFGTLSLV